MLAAEQMKCLRVITRDSSYGAPIDDLPKVYAVNQGGLLDVAPAPAGAASRWLDFVFAEAGGGDQRSALTHALDANAMHSQ